MQKSTLMRVAAAAVIGLGGTAAVGTAAMANPSGCTKTIGSWGQLGGGDLFANFSGSCSTSASRTLQGEIKQDLSLRPDPVALQGADVDNRSYLVALQGCDHGKSANYYARVFFKGYTDYTDTKSTKFDVC